MKQRSIFTVALLSLFTLGFYPIYYLATTNTFFKKNSYPTRPNWWFYFSYVSGFVAFILFFVGLFSLYDQVGSGSSTETIDSSGAAFLILIAIAGFIFFIGLGLYYMAFWRYLNIAQNYTKGGVDPIIHVALLLFFPIAVFPLLQHEYNKLLGGDNNQFAPNPAPQPQQKHTQNSQPLNPSPVNSQQNPQDQKFAPNPNSPKQNKQN